MEAARQRVRSTASEALRISGPFSKGEDSPDPFWLGFLVAVRPDGSKTAHFWEYDSHGIGHKGVTEHLVKTQGDQAYYGGLIFLEAERRDQKIFVRPLRIHRSQTDQLFLHIGQMDDVKELLMLLNQDSGLQIEGRGSVTLVWQSLEAEQRLPLESLLSR